MLRRDFIKLSGFVVSLLMLPFSAIAGVWNKLAFEATERNIAEAALGVNAEIASKAIDIVAPDRAENGAIVQVEVTSRIPDTTGIAIFVEKNPTALIGNYVLTANIHAKIITRIKMAETSDIKIVVQAGGKYYSASKSVQVMENGCGGGGSADDKFDPSIKMRAKLVADMVEVKAIMIHPMHTGHAKDDFGQLIPADFIQLVDVKLNEKPVLQIQWGTGIAKNPYLTFYLKDAKSGDRISLTWHDNHGRTASGETIVNG
ncbi:MAG TPA: thiosulfate oxidation carrier complex protein SoxZ [Methylophilus sp.]|nr:thiosulfate oxidation carrier complex protein SoxZ [Methylophilus sp.]HQQ32771.1 thiosulfate oxidation carrier complex protein SoxZ [Methylophilus sp.]